ncbi:hypothetical protein O6H91_09G058700 [Diphasiastrum complanatum]|uniref:Uncharacterized protein n=1 Tax=Diphasiastrum complanatum TaxID=34168 RepID=A0ACC2CPG4_DIPCM|nr:hypothetical protein O6H91_09G058700 [Diphasiastrum complanatum]
MDSMYIVTATIAAAFLLILFIILHGYKYTPTKTFSCKKAKHPPGKTWSLPFFGETIQFLQDPHQFHLQHISRYGETFSSSLFGENCIVLTTPEATRWVLQTAQKYFKPGYPRSATSMIDETGSIYGENFHSRMRKVLGPALHPDAMQHQVKYIDFLANFFLNKWRDNETCNVLQQLRRYTFFVASEIIFGLKPGPEVEKMADQMEELKKGFLSLHINLPFTTYGKALRARDGLYQTLQKLIDRRRLDPNPHNDVLDFLLRANANGDHFSDVHVRAIILTLMFGGYESTSSQLVWAIKRLHDNPKILDKVLAEQDFIRQRKVSQDEPLTWADVKDMKYTSQVLQETMRTSFLNTFIPREALIDLEYDGFIFPKGCKVHASISSFHLSPKVFPDPYRFEPDRFQDNSQPGTFMPFGYGNRLCLGSDLAKSQMLIFIHHLVTKYRYEAISPDQEIRWWPMATPKRGFPIRIQKRDE